MYATPRVDMLIARIEETATGSAGSSLPVVLNYIAAHFRELRAAYFTEKETLAACRDFIAARRGAVLLASATPSDPSYEAVAYERMLGWIDETENLIATHLRMPLTTALISRLYVARTAAFGEDYRSIYACCADLLLRAREAGLATDRDILSQFASQLDTTVDALTAYGEKGRAGIYASVREWARQ